MKTHEKTHQTMWLALKMILVLSCIYALFSCGKSPTAPTKTLHPKELLITEYTKCFCEKLRVPGEITVGFWEETKFAPCSEGSDLDCPIAGTAYPYSNHADYWGPWVRGETQYDSSDGELAYSALHESCHLSGIWSESRAKSCADLNFKNQSCYKVPESWIPTNDYLIR